MADLRDWIGRQDVAEDTITPGLVARFAATLDEKCDVAEGAVAPLAIHLCLAPPAVPASGLGHDGHPALGGFLPPVPLPRRMWAGGAFAFHAPLQVGDTVTRRSVIADVQEKQGRTGRLVFVTVDHALSVGGQVRIAERQDIVYRDAGAPAPPAADPAPAGRWQAMVQPDATLLFRYSALTFNGHRIHYDLDFARQVEGYPGLVVHGPLLATQLCRMAERLRGMAPAMFRFRSLSTLFHDAPYALNAAEDGPALRLWAARPGGPVAMEAVAEW
jgi:3-methylfumaryl-CoA hydratase